MNIQKQIRFMKGARKIYSAEGKLKTALLIRNKQCFNTITQLRVVPRKKFESLDTKKVFKKY